MSHYNVAVFSYDPNAFDRLLAPYSEEDPMFMCFSPLTEKERKWYEDYYKEHKRDIPGSFEEFLTSEGFIVDTLSGKVGRKVNPDAKWDWYTLGGGSWQFELKDDHVFDDDDNVRKNDFVYVVDGNWEYPYAFITPDGKWHAPGTVGWFATSDDTPESREAYLREWIAWIESDENPYVNFVDCHI